MLLRGALRVGCEPRLLFPPIIKGFKGFRVGPERRAHLPPHTPSGQLGGGGSRRPPGSHFWSLWGEVPPAVEHKQCYVPAASVWFAALRFTCLLVRCIESLRQLRVRVVGLSYPRAAQRTGMLKYAPGKADYRARHPRQPEALINTDLSRPAVDRLAIATKIYPWALIRRMALQKT